MVGFGGGWEYFVLVGEVDDCDVEFGFFIDFVC